MIRTVRGIFENAVFIKIADIIGRPVLYILVRMMICTG